MLRTHVHIIAFHKHVHFFERPKPKAERDYEKASPANTRGYKNQARKINLLTEAGVRDSHCVEYWRASAQDRPGFLLKEGPEMVVQAITDNAERAVQVSTVVNADRIDTVGQAVATGLGGVHVTITTLPVDSVKVVPS